MRGIGKTFDSLGPSVFSELRTLERRPVDRSSAESPYSVYFDGVGRVDDTPVYLLDKLQVGDVVQGPAMIIDDTQTIGLACLERKRRILVEPIQVCAILREIHNRSIYEWLASAQFSNKICHEVYLGRVPRRRGLRH